MITNPSCGWCEFHMGDFTGNPSYLTDVPIELLEAFLNYKLTGRAMVWFDEEGSEFTLVMNPYSIFIIEEKEESVLHDIDRPAGELLEELLSDVEDHLDEWFTDFLLGEKQELMQKREYVQWLIHTLRYFNKTKPNKELCHALVSAMRKQTPLSPNPPSICPSCREGLIQERKIGEQPNYCCNCGQRIDWMHKKG